MPKPSHTTHYLFRDYDVFAMAEKIRSIRASRGYNLTEFGKLVGTSDSILSKIERHEISNISKRLVRNISEKFAIPMSELVIPRDPNADQDRGLYKWIENPQESLLYLRAAYYMYLKDKGKIE